MRGLYAAGVPQYCGLSEKKASEVDVPRVDWGYICEFGTNDYCNRWEAAYESSVNKHNNPCIISQETGIDRKCWWVPWAGHTLFKATFCNGLVIYVDSGTAGGADHLAVELPPQVY